MRYKNISDFSGIGSKALSSHFTFFEVITILLKNCSNAIAVHIVTKDGRVFNNDYNMFDQLTSLLDQPRCKLYIQTRFEKRLKWGYVQFLRDDDEKKKKTKK